MVQRVQHGTQITITSTLASQPIETNPRTITTQNININNEMMLSEPVPAQRQENASLPEEVKDRAFVSDYNETDYSDFLYLAPPLMAEFLPLSPTVTDQAAAQGAKKAKIRPAETFNTGTTPPPVTPAEGFKKEYFQATYPPSRARTPLSPEAQAAAERRERRPSFVEVTPVKVHHEHDKHGATHREKRHSHSSHESEPMNWWPESEAIAQHEWEDEGAEEEDVIEEEVWSDAFYE